MAPIWFRIAPRIGALAVAALLLLTVALGRAAAETPDTITTQLQPGINFVGWVGPETPVVDLFDDVPEIEAVYAWAWDGSRRTWLSASPRVPVELHTFETLTTGTGLVLRVGGAEEVEWVRPLVPGSGFVWLVRGLNLAPWVGDAGDTLQNAGLDARPWFLAAHAWDPVSNQYRTYDPQAPATIDALSQVHIGDALWIEVGEGSEGYWDQRSDSLSQIRGVLTGPEGEPFVDFGVTAIALDSNDNWFYGFTNSDGSFFIPVRTGVPYILRFHHDGKPGCWLFYKDDLAVKDGQTASPLRADSTDPTFVTFQALDGACGWEIRGQLIDADGSPLVGRTITALPAGVVGKQGVETAQDGSFTIVTDEDGPHRLHISLTDDCVLHYRDGGITASADNESLIQVADAHVDGVTIAVPADACRWSIRGAVVDSDGQPLAGVEIGSYRNRKAQTLTRTANDGSFSIPVPLNGSYELKLNLDGDCSVYYGPDGTATDRNQAESVWVRDSDVTDLQIAVPDWPCGFQITGRVVNRDGDAVNGAIHAIAEDRSEFGSSIRDDGSFSIVGPAQSGPWRLRVSFRPGCFMYYGADGAVSAWDAASLVTIADVRVTGIQVVVPNQACNWWIKGRIVDAMGFARSDVEINVWDNRNRFYGKQPVEADGSFAVRVNEEEHYRIEVSLGPWCFLYHASGKWAIADAQHALWISAGDHDAPGVVVRLPNNACGWLISGTIVDSEHRRLPGIQVIAVGPEGATWGTVSGADGSFSVNAPSSGSYDLRAEPQEWCAIPLGTVEATKGGSEDTDEHLADARPISFDVEIPANACERRIQGSLIDADGQGVADKWLWAMAGELGRGGTFTESDGSFVITVPVTGVYTLGFWVSDDCYVYYNESADASPNHASHVTVGDADVTGITIRIPDNPCG